MIINVLAEGFTEEHVATRLLHYCGHELGVVYGRKGCDYVRQKASFFHHLATADTGVLVLSDFRDTGETCVPNALQEYVLKKIPVPPKTFLCRFAVNEIESWLMADREGISNYIGVALSKVPLQPENEEFPKRTLINLSRSSRIKRIRNGFAPPVGHYSDVGPKYMNLIHEYVNNFWNIEAAMKIAKSLERCIYRLRSL